MAININLLQRAESDLRERVEKSPSDPEVRQGLAFCLLLLATYAAGQESAARQHLLPDPPAAPGESVSDEADRLDSAELMRQHLKHMHVLKLLSPDAHEEPWRLHSLSLGQLFAEAPDTAVADLQNQQALARVVGAVRSAAAEDPFSKD